MTGKNELERNDIRSIMRRTKTLAVNEFSLSFGGVSDAVGTAFCPTVAYYIRRYGPCQGKNAKIAKW